MSRSPLRTATSVAAFAVVASSGLALTTAVGTAVAVTSNGDPVATDTYSLSIALATKSIDPGDSDTVSGVLTKSGVPQSGETIALRARVHGRHHRAHRVATSTSGTDGSVSFTVTPPTDTHYRLVFRADSSTTPTASPSPVPTPVSTPNFVGARSKIVTVHILRESSLSIRAREGRNGHEVIQGQLRSRGHGLPSRQVTLRARAVGSDTWTTVRVRRTHRHGIVWFRLAAPSAPEEFQLAYAGGPRYHGCQSGVVTIG